MTDKKRHRKESSSNSQKKIDLSREEKEVMEFCWVFNTTVGINVIWVGGKWSNSRGINL